MPILDTDSMVSCQAWSTCKVYLLFLPYCPVNKRFGHSEDQEKNWISFRRERDYWILQQAPCVSLIVGARTASGAAAGRLVWGSCQWRAIPGTFDMIDREKCKKMKWVHYHDWKKEGRHEAEDTIVVVTLKSRCLLIPEWPSGALGRGAAPAQALEGHSAGGIILMIKVTCEGSCVRDNTPIYVTSFTHVVERVNHCAGAKKSGMNSSRLEKKKLLLREW